MATRWSKVPGGDDDVIERSREDVQKVRKGLNVDKSNLKGGARDAVREAGSRAGARLVNRAGAAQLAFTGGYEAGRALDEKTGVGKKMVEKSGLGDLAEKAVNRRDKVELSKSAKERVDEDDRFKEVERVLRETDEDIESSKYGKGDKLKRGGRVSVSKASRRADGIATKGKTRGRIL
jgi:hypothetical protein